MTGLRAVLDVPEWQCLLCGEEAETYTDLCDRCNGVFQATAHRVAAAVVGTPTVVVLQVAGQLDLTADAGCSCGWQGATEDVDAHLEVCALPDPWAFEYDQDDQP